MTKIKNTKKGMAKKTLSMSLVVAMLATSNVPVWAAEFSDGTDVAVTSEAEAPAVDTADEFSDNAAEAPVVADDTTDVPAAQVAEGYTVNTNMELKSVDWESKLELVKKEGITDDAKFEILDNNTVAVVPTKVEIYSGDNLCKSQNITKAANETVLTALNNALSTATTNGLGLDAYKYSKQVTIKVYVDGNNEPVYETSATVKPVTLDKTWTVTADKSKDPYNGKIQTPSVTVKKSGYKNADVVVKFDDEKEAKNVGKYSYTVEGVEENGYVGTISGGEYEITPVTPNKDNLSIAVSGNATFNGTKTQPTVVVTDKLTNTVIPSDLYEVSVSNTAAGTYTKDTKDYVTVKLLSTFTTADKKKLTNNFAAGEITDRELYSGSYTVSALDLSKLGEKYDITVASKKVGEEVTKADFTFVDKATKKTVPYDDVIPKATTLSATNSTTIVTSGNTAVGTGKVTIKATNAKDTEIVGEYNTTFNVVNATIKVEDLSFPAGTKVGTTTLNTKTDLVNATIFSSSDTNHTVLKDETYTGSAIEPYKEAFSNLVLKNSATVTDQKLVLGTDYDIVYENNTDSNAVSEKTPTVKLVFKGNYSGTVPFTFTINKATAEVKAADLEYIPGKATYDIAAKVTVNGKDVPTSAYTVTTTKKATNVVNDSEAEGVVVFENKNYELKVNGKVPTTQVDSVKNVTENGGITKDGRYCVKISTTLTGRKLSNCTATVEGNYVYTGEAISPKLVVKDGNTTLVEGIDYRIVSKTGTNAGAAHVTIEGKGNYKGTLTLDYTIAKANLSNATVLNSDDKKDYDVAYSGVAVTPDIKTVKIGNKTLTEYDPVTKKGDYTIKWDDAIEVGTYNFTITAVAGSQNVEGEYKGTFKVTANQLTGKFVTKIGDTVANADTPITVDKTGAYYTGSAITIDSFKTKYVLKKTDAKGNLTDKVLTEGKDYELVYTDNVNAGKATVVAYGLGNYAKVDNKGKKAPIASMTFFIGNKATINQDWVQKISDVEYAGGLPVEPTVVVVNPTTKERLVQGKDYTVETKVVDVTTKTDKNGNLILLTQNDVTIKGLGAYTTTDSTNTAISFTKVLNWKVTKKDFANTTISVDKDNNVTVMNGTVVVPSSEYDAKISDDGKKVTVTAKADSKNYTGSKEITVESAKVGQPMISNVVVKGNTATPVLSGDVDGAVGYDYVIATEEDYANGRVGISKNILKTNTNFYYVQKGTYYAYCHAWKRDANGKKVFGEWSNLYKFTVTATTPSTPAVTSVKAKGNTVTVTYTKSADATGYDVVLGSSVKSVNGEKRPVDFGELVKKNVKGNTVTVTFKNVPAGTYYAGLHSFNRTSEDGKKVFSKWSNAKKVTVK